MLLFRTAVIRMGELRREHEKMLMDGISDEEKAVLCRCLDRMLDNCLNFESSFDAETAV